ncbi:MAG: hypothetical protein LUP95_07275 [Euryarchaeota archaeon]|jgi:hypothetical protein|nr:hypothetical protein [Euryarchaeota archaeon]
MASDQLNFQTKKIRITIDYSRCEPATKNTSNPTCGFACVKACRLYGRNILKIEGNKPVLAVTDPKEIERLDNECVSCEYQCWARGTNCIRIEIPLPGMEEYRREVLGA